MKPRHLRWARRAMILMAAMPLLQANGCGTFTAQATQTFLNGVPSVIFNNGVQLLLSILNGTSQFLFQSGGFFGGGFGGS
jgi:hypothetical protein